MKERAYGKINLSIDVVSKREDGYHNLDMIMLPIGLFDTIKIELAEKDSYHCNVDLPFDQGNIIYKCVKLLRDTFQLQQHFKIEVQKNVPANAGLAGGSSDGAATLRIINKLCNLNLSLEQLAQLGKSIGADIPFCIYSVPARVKGIGDLVRPINLKDDLDVLLIKPKAGISTPLAFKLLDLEKCEHPNMEELERRFVSGEDYSSFLGNSLQYSGFQIVPEVNEIIQYCKGLGYPNTLMTGSGSTVFVIDEREKLQKLFVKVKNKFEFVYLTTIINE